jgi:hypothetical protein
MPDQNVDSYHPNFLISKWMWRRDNGFTMPLDQINATKSSMENRKLTEAWETYPAEVKDYINYVISDLDVMASGLQ